MYRIDHLTNLFDITNSWIYVIEMLLLTKTVEYVYWNFGKDLNGNDIPGAISVAMGIIFGEDYIRFQMFHP
jgi:hypothetical protein